MRKSNHLTRLQHTVIDELISDDRPEHEILEKCKVSRRTFERWQRDPAFLEQFELRSAMAYRRGKAMIADNMRKAVTRLATLTKKDTGETVRKACMDIISVSTPCAQSPPSPAQAEPDELSDDRPFSPEIAARLLAVLAEERNGAEDGQ